MSVGGKGGGGGGEMCLAVAGREGEEGWGKDWRGYRRWVEGGGVMKGVWEGQEIKMTGENVGDKCCLVFGVWCVDTMSMCAYMRKALRCNMWKQGRGSTIRGCFNGNAEVSISRSNLNRLSATARRKW